MVGGSYQRGVGGLTYRGWRVLIRGEGGLVAVIDESATDQAERTGIRFRCPPAETGQPQGEQEVRRLVDVLRGRGRVRPGTEA